MIIGVIGLALSDRHGNHGSRSLSITHLETADIYGDGGLDGK